MTNIDYYVCVDNKEAQELRNLLMGSGLFRAYSVGWVT